MKNVWNIYSVALQFFIAQGVMLLMTVYFWAGLSVEPISEERASRSLYRIQLLSKIREEVLFNYCCPVAATIKSTLLFCNCSVDKCISFNRGCSAA